MKRTLNAIVIHCSAGPNLKPATAKDIDSIHKAAGFKRDSQAVRNFNPGLRHIGYHFVIDVDGRIDTGRAIEEVGAHVRGNNSKSIGICLIGTSKFTKEQCAALRTCILQLLATILRRPVMSATAAMAHLKDIGITVQGHRDYSPDLNGDGIIQRKEWIKTCPGFSVAKWLQSGMAVITEDDSK